MKLVAKFRGKGKILLKKASALKGKFPYRDLDLDRRLLLEMCQPTKSSHKDILQQNGEGDKDHL
jgi:hypothetical protein